MWRGPTTTVCAEDTRTTPPHDHDSQGFASLRPCATTSVTTRIIVCFLCWVARKFLTTSPLHIAVIDDATTTTTTTSVRRCTAVRPSFFRVCCYSPFSSKYAERPRSRSGVGALRAMIHAVSWWFCKCNSPVRALVCESFRCTRKVCSIICIYS